MSSPVVADAAVRRGVRSTYLVFAAQGFVFANWAARIPQVKVHLGLTPGQLGLLLLAMAAGSVLSLAVVGPLITRIGSARTVEMNAVGAMAGFVIVAIGYLQGVALVAVGLVIAGFASGAWDGAQNVQGAAVERLLGKAIMPRFHASWSLGMVTGALLSSLMIILDVPVTAHLITASLVVTLAALYSVRGFVPDHPDDPTHSHDRTSPDTAHRERKSARHALTAWTEPRTLLAGLFVLAFAFAEGAGNDWINLALVDDYHTPAAVGTLGFAMFLAAMTAGRWFGPPLLDRFGRVRVLRPMTLLAIAGVLLFALGPATPFAFVGAVAWGLGICLGFPVGMSAGADDPRRAAARVSVIASIGYCAFLGGPPLLGFLADHLTVVHALIAVAVLLAISALVTDAVRESGPRASHPPAPVQTSAPGASAASAARLDADQ